MFALFALGLAASLSDDHEIQCTRECTKFQPDTIGYDSGPVCMDMKALVTQHLYACYQTPIGCIGDDPLCTSFAHLSTPDPTAAPTSAATTAPTLSDAGVECGCPEGSSALSDDKKEICRREMIPGVVTSCEPIKLDGLCPAGMDPCVTENPTNAPTAPTLSDAGTACGCSIETTNGQLSDNKKEICVQEPVPGIVTTCEPIQSTGLCPAGGLFKPCESDTPTSAASTAATTAGPCSGNDEIVCPFLFGGKGRCEKVELCSKPDRNGTKLCTTCPQSCEPVGCCDGLPGECTSSPTSAPTIPPPTGSPTIGPDIATTPPPPPPPPSTTPPPPPSTTPSPPSTTPPEKEIRLFAYDNGDCNDEGRLINHYEEGEGPGKDHKDVFQNGACLDPGTVDVTEDRRVTCNADNSVTMRVYLSYDGTCGTEADKDSSTYTYAPYDGDGVCFDWPLQSVMFVGKKFSVQCSAPTQSTVPQSTISSNTTDVTSDDSTSLSPVVIGGIAGGGVVVIGVGVFVITRMRGVSGVMHQNLI